MALIDSRRTANWPSVKVPYWRWTVDELVKHESAKPLVVAARITVSVGVRDRDLIVPDHIEEIEICCPNRKFVLIRETAFVFGLISRDGLEGFGRLNDRQAGSRVPGEEGPQRGIGETDTTAPCPLSAGSNGVDGRLRIIVSDVHRRNGRRPDEFGMPAEFAPSEMLYTSTTGASPIGRLAS